MRPNAALEIIDCSGNLVSSEDHSLLQRMNLQCLQKCSSLGWPFGANHQNYTCPGTGDKAFNIYSIWKKPYPLQKWSILQTYVLCFPPALLHSLERVSWIGQVFHWKTAEFFIHLPFLWPFSNHNQTHWRNAAMVCDCDSSSKDHWAFPSVQPCSLLALIGISPEGLFAGKKVDAS